MGEAASGARSAPNPSPSPGGSQTTDESWPDAPSDEDDGRPAEGPGGARGSAPSPGLAAARSAARAAAQAGPRQAWPETVPGRARSGQETSDDVDPLNDADADVDELTGMALIQRELGGRVIEEIDHS